MKEKKIKQLSGLLVYKKGTIVYKCVELYQGRYTENKN